MPGTRRQPVIEANENVDLVTTRRQQDLERARREYRSAVTEGRLAVRSARQENAQLAVATSATFSTSDTTSASASAAEAVEVQPVGAAPEPADPEAAWRYTRLALTAALVVVLLVVWIWQKKGGR